MKKLKRITIVWVILGTILIAEMVAYGALHEFNSFWTNIYVAAIGSASGFLVVNRTKRYTDAKSHLEMLIRKAGSSVDSVVIEAIEELSALGYIADGTLRHPNYGRMGEFKRFTDERNKRLSQLKSKRNK